MKLNPLDDSEVDRIFLKHVRGEIVNCNMICIYVKKIGWITDTKELRTWVYQKMNGSPKTMGF